jgi:hypothetical protein
VYAAIGARIAAQGYDVHAGRAVVSGLRKLLLVLLAFVSESATRAVAPLRRKTTALEMSSGR